MHSQNDFSELDEISDLLEDLLVPHRPDPAGKDGERLWEAVDRLRAAMESMPGERAPGGENAPPPPRQEPPSTVVPGSAPPAAAPPPPEPDPNASTGDKLTALLEQLCTRGGFSCAIISDPMGLPLAEYNSPVDTDVLAGFTLTMGTTIDKAGHFLGQHEANNISLDINFVDKAVVRKFMVEGIAYFILVICPQDVDERGEIELSIDRITTTLTRRA